MIKKFFKKYNVLDFFKKFDALKFFENKRNVKIVMLFAFIILITGGYIGEILGVVMVLVGLVIMVFTALACLINILRPKW